MAEPNKINISVHAPLPGDDEVSLVLFEHLSKLAADAEVAGWEVAVTLTLTREKKEGTDE